MLEVLNLLNGIVSHFKIFEHTFYSSGGEFLPALVKFTSLALVDSEKPWSLRQFPDICLPHWKHYRTQEEDDSFVVTSTDSGRQDIFFRAIGGGGGGWGGIAIAKFPCEFLSVLVKFFFLSYPWPTSGDRRGIFRMSRSSPYLYFLTSHGCLATPAAKIRSAGKSTSIMAKIYTQFLVCIKKNFVFCKNLKGLTIIQVSLCSKVKTWGLKTQIQWRLFESAIRLLRSKKPCSLKVDTH